MLVEAERGVDVPRRLLRHPWGPALLELRLRPCGALLGFKFQEDSDHRLCQGFPAGLRKIMTSLCPMSYIGHVLVILRPDEVVMVAATQADLKL